MKLAVNSNSATGTTGGGYLIGATGGSPKRIATSGWLLAGIIRSSGIHNRRIGTRRASTPTTPAQSAETIAE
jgi:hypothetical protein